MGGRPLLAVVEPATSVLPLPVLSLLLLRCVGGACCCGCCWAPGCRPCCLGSVAAAAAVGERRLRPCGLAGAAKAASTSESGRASAGAVCALESRLNRGERGGGEGAGGGKDMGQEWAA